MTEDTKPEYELRKRSKNYVGLYLGDHCLAAICVNTPRRLRDAQFLLRLCVEHEGAAGQAKQPGGR